MARLDPTAKRDRILNAALRVFAAKGFYKTKVAEIARAAKVADGTIYNYFRSKDDLLISVFEDRMEWILRRLKEELGGDVIAQIRRYIELHLYLSITDPDLAEFITVELRQSDKFLREYKNPKFAEFLRVLAALIEQGQREGVVRKTVDAKLASRAIFGALDEMLLTLCWSQQVDEREVQTLANQVADLFLGGLLAHEGVGDDPVK